MKLYTYFSDSHRIFLNNFVSTFPFESDFDLEIKYMPQICSGLYLTDNWANFIKEKVKYVLEIIYRNDGDEYFVFSDIDVQFFGNIKADLMYQLGLYDIVFQNDFDFCCAGFFICRKNLQTFQLFSNILANIVDREESVLNYELSKGLINYGQLNNKYWTYGCYKQYWVGQEFGIPEDILVHHANWTTGLENKILLLKTVRNKYVELHK